MDGLSLPDSPVRYSSQPYDPTREAMLIEAVRFLGQELERTQAFLAQYRDTKLRDADGQSVTALAKEASFGAQAPTPFSLVDESDPSAPAVTKVSVTTFAILKDRLDANAVRTIKGVGSVFEVVRGSVVYLEIRLSAVTGAVEAAEVFCNANGWSDYPLPVRFEQRPAVGGPPDATYYQQTRAWIPLHRIVSAADLDAVGVSASPGPALGFGRRENALFAWPCVTTHLCLMDACIEGVAALYPFASAGAFPG